MSSHHNRFLGDSKEGLPTQAGVFLEHKKPGETLAVLLMRFRKEHSFSQDTPITYAGRLDPMAEGLVILLVGDTCKDKESYLGLDKVYTFEVLFGVATDTFDMLGMVTESNELIPTTQQVEKALEQIKKVTTFSYPPYSSKPIDGAPLFVHAKAGTLPEKLPTIHGEVYSIVLQNTAIRPIREVVERSIEVIKKVEGEFRQEEIMKNWEIFLKNKSNIKSLIATFEVSVSSGMYVRTIATLIGKELGGVALAYSIKRTKVGKFIL